MASNFFFDSRHITTYVKREISSILVTSRQFAKISTY